MGSLISVPFICIGVCTNLEIKTWKQRVFPPAWSQQSFSVVALELFSSGSLITLCSLLLGCCFKLNKDECLLDLRASGVFVYSASGLAKADKPEMQMFRIICVCTFYWSINNIFITCRKRAHLHSLSSRCVVARIFARPYYHANVSSCCVCVFRHKQEEQPRCDLIRLHLIGQLDKSGHD